MVKNADMPASPAYHEGVAVTLGLTKREHACIALRVPETGDPELDALIRTAHRRDVAAMAMQGIISVGEHWHPGLAYDAAARAVNYADALLAALSGEPKP